ncbi:MAG: hypothetical protein KF900_03960 [Bacteroidetes bacterium]|nr:hypothetical protein [Bacteroidota bacterium]
MKKLNRLNSLWIKSSVYCSLLLLLTNIYACRKKEKIVEIEKIVYQETVHKWKRVDYFTQLSDEFIKSVKYVGKGFIFFSATYTDVIYDSTTNQFTALVGFMRDQQIQPLITEKYKLELYTHGFNLVPHNNLPSFPIDYTEKQVYIEKYDSTFLGFVLFNYPEIMGTGNNVLSVYQTKSGGVYNYMGFKLSYNDFYLYAANGKYIQVDSVKVFQAPLSYASNRFLGTVGTNILFVMGNERNYALTENLDTVFINNTYSFKDIFQYKNTYYAIARTTLASGNAGENCLIQSSDNGLSWQEIAKGLNYDYTYLNFEQIGDKLIAYFNNQIWEMAITSDNISTKELDNDGLKNKRIKGITMSNNRVFISTESGVFERPYQEFIEYK